MPEIRSKPKPQYRIPGAEVAGRVEATGPGVTQFRPGDEVFGDLSEHGRSGFAEFAVGPESAFAAKPVNASFEQAAAIAESGLVALQALRDAGRIQPGHKVLISGAAGGIGTFAIQVAKSFGAEVTAVCGPDNLDLVRALGADQAIDYTRQDFTRGDERYDLVLGIRGYHPIRSYKRVLTTAGSYVCAGGGLRQFFEVMALGPRLSEAGGRRLVGLSLKPNQADMIVMKDLVEAGEVAPVIDGHYALADTAQALRHYSTAHARGNVVISVGHEPGEYDVEHDVSRVSGRRQGAA
jgi:NADPH:quinone reductase-like Zn-dependent oxidoreductase